MSSPLSRRGLFSAFLPKKRQEPEAAAEKPGFSLERFYAERAKAGHAAMPPPPFARREGLPDLPATQVGTGSPKPTGHPGFPVVTAAHCLGPTSFCTVCVERCPVPGALVMVEGIPRVDRARCNGCGDCMPGCPAPAVALEWEVPGVVP